MNNDDFSAGVKILLQRMETNPEEFYKTLIPNSYESISNVKWHDIMYAIMKSKLGDKSLDDALFLSDAEVDALFDGYTLIRRKAFDDRVMRELLVTEDKQAELSQQTYQAKAMAQIRTGITNNNVNAMQGYVNPYQNAKLMYPQQGNAASSAAQAQGLMNAYMPEPQHPEVMPDSIIAQIAKRMGLK